MVGLAVGALRVGAVIMEVEVVTSKVCTPFTQSMNIFLLIRGIYTDYGGSSGGFRDNNGQRGFDEYNAGDDEISAPRRSNSTTVRSSGTGAAPRSSTSSTAPSAPPASAPTKTPAKVVDLLGFGDEDDFSAPVSAPARPAPEKALPAVSSNPLDGA